MGGQGGARAPPSFGISVNPIRPKGVRLCRYRVNLNVNISVKRLVHDSVKVIFNVRKQRERHSFSEAGARYKKNHDFLRSSWWFSAFVKRGRPYKMSE